MTTITITIPKLEPISTVELLLLAAMPVVAALTLAAVAVAWDLWQNRQANCVGVEPEETQ